MNNTLPLKMAYKQAPNFSWKDKTVFTDKGVWTNGVVAVWEDKPFVANYKTVEVLTSFNAPQKATLEALKDLLNRELDEVALVEIRVLYAGPCYARFENETTSFWIDCKQLKAVLNPRGPWSWTQTKQDKVRLLATKFPPQNGILTCLVLEQSGKMVALIASCNPSIIPKHPDLHITLNPDYERS